MPTGDLFAQGLGSVLSYGNNQTQLITTSSACINSIRNLWCQPQSLTTGSLQQRMQVWPVWNQEYAGNVVWINGNVNVVAQPPLSAEQIQELQARQARIDQENAVRQAELAKQRKEAADRAAALLSDHLAPEQRETFEKQRHFVVHSRDGQRRYRVEYGTAGNVKLLNAEGKAVAKFCIHPVDSRIPTEDVMLTQKLMIEGDEESFLRIANRTALAA